MIRKPRHVSDVSDTELQPIVDVELVPVSIDTRAVVDVTMRPAGPLTRLGHLPTLAALQAVRRSGPKPSTKLDRAIANKTARLLDANHLQVWARAVKDRDQWKDRRTGVRVKSTRQLDPLRAEAHHIESRDDWAVRYDVRNGICLSFATHYALTHHQLRIEGTVWFVKNGCRYIDGRFPVIFVRL